MRKKGEQAARRLTGKEKEEFVFSCVRARVLRACARDAIARVNLWGLMGSVRGTVGLREQVFMKLE